MGDFQFQRLLFNSLKQCWKLFGSERLSPKRFCDAAQAGQKRRIGSRVVELKILHYLDLYLIEVREWLEQRGNRKTAGQVAEAIDIVDSLADRASRDDDAADSAAALSLSGGGHFHA